MQKYFQVAEFTSTETIDVSALLIFYFHINLFFSLFEFSQ